MAKSTPGKSSSRPKPAVPTPASSQFEIVDPMWLAKAAVITVAVALVCGYLTLCLLVYQGQWQLVLHPDASKPATMPSAALPFEKIPFGATENGQPRLAGWWIPASGGPRAATTVLFLHDGSGNLGANVGTLEALHQIGVNVFAFDYRGFGASDPAHPNQEHMSEDAGSALDYLVNTRHLAAGSIVPYGAGLGAALAANLAVQHPELPGLIVESPVPDVLAVAKSDARASFVPLSLLFHERFEVGPALAAVKTPKLLLSAGPSPVTEKRNASGIEQIYQRAASPSRVVHLDPGAGAAYQEALERFLDEFVPAGHAKETP